MFRLIRGLLHPNAGRRRFLNGVLGAFLLAVLSYSSAFASIEADHDCDGHDCAVCQEMQSCLGTCQLIGSAAAATASAVPDVSPAEPDFIPHASRARAITLLSLDVRFDE